MTAILVTRPDAGADPVIGALKAAGYRVHAVPTVAINRLQFARPELAGYDWVVVTSASGVDALDDLPAGPRWAAVGPATARALRARGIEPALVPEEANGLALANAMPDAGGKHVLLVRAAAAAPDLPGRLRERGAEVDELAAYATLEGPASSAEPLTVALCRPVGCRLRIRLGGARIHRTGREDCIAGNYHRPPHDKSCPRAWFPGHRGGKSTECRGPGGRDRRCHTT